MAGTLEHEEGGGAAERACQSSTVVKCGWFRRTLADLESEWLSRFSVSASHPRLHSSAMGLCSFWDLEVFLQTHMVVERTGFLKVVGLQPSAPAVSHMLLAPWPSTDSSHHSSLSYQGSCDQLHHLQQGMSPCATVRVESVKPHRSSACTPGWTCTLHPHRKRI